MKRKLNYLIHQKINQEHLNSKDHSLDKLERKNKRNILQYLRGCYLTVQIINVLGVKITTWVRLDKSNMISQHHNNVRALFMFL